jgi:serine/threonine protein kinase
MALDTGTSLDSYEITALTGRGGMSEAYRAAGTRLKRDVAIKTMNWGIE